MKLNTIKTMSNCSSLEKGAIAVGENSIKTVKTMSGELTRQSEGMAEGNSFDHDTSSLLHKTKTASMPIVTAVAAPLMQTSYRKNLEMFAKKYNDTAGFVDIMKSHDVYMLEEHTSSSKLDKAVTEEGFISKTIDVKQYGKIIGKEDLTLKDVSKLGNYKIKDGMITVFEPERLDSLQKAANLTLLRMKNSEVSFHDPNFKKMTEFGADVDSLIRKGEKAKLLTSPKRLGMQFFRSFALPVQSTEAMNGFQMAQACMAPVKVTGKLANRGANYAGHYVAQKILEKKAINRYSKMTKDDAKRFAKSVLSKKYSKKNFFADYKTREVMKYVKDQTKFASSEFGKTLHGILDTNLKNGTTAKGAFKRAGKEALKSSISNTRIGKATAKAGEAAAKVKGIVAKPFQMAGNKLAQTKLAKTAQKIFGFQQRLKKSIANAIKALIQKMITALGGIMGSFTSMLMSALLAVLPIIITILLIVIVVGFIIALMETKPSSEWVEICQETKKVIAERAAEEGYTNENAYSQTGYLNSVTINEKTKNVRRDCSGYVSACLYYYGTFESETINWASYSFVENTNLAGFEKITDYEYTDLQQGDILAKKGHVEIFDRIEGDNVYVWSNGCGSHVLKSESTIDNSVKNKKYPVVWRYKED